MSIAQPLTDHTSALFARPVTATQPEAEMLYTPLEYLRREREATEKSEYLGGRIIAMAGASLPHIAAATDLRRSLGNRLERGGANCEVFDNDLKVRVEERGPYYYPDITIVCGEPEMDRDGCLLNPVVIVEVLSPSTENRDRGQKFRHYRSMPSLRHYVMVSLSEVLVEHFARQSDGVWSLVGEHDHLDADLVLADLKVTVPLREIYRRVPFVPPPAIPLTESDIPEPKASG